MSSNRNLVSQSNPQAGALAQIIDTLKRNPRILLLALGALASAGMYLSYRKKKPQIALLPKGSKLTDPHILVKSPLTYTEAVHRSSAISRLEYHLTLNLKPGTSYEGRVTIEFELEKVIADLFVDYFGKYVQNATLNGQDITSPTIFANHRIHLPTEHLKTGLNKLKVNFGNDYANDGSGLHSFIDVDQRQYIYSQCAPCYAHRIFPCFDQPDLKAPLKLRLITPTEWKTIANSVIDHTEEPTEQYFQDHGFTNFGPNLTLTKFRRTPPISTYLYAILAGSYVEIPNASSYKNLKMSLYCRQSVQNHAKNQAQLMFDVTCAGMKYYEELFDTPFAFAKYDLILCPEFNWGAMENVGAVTVAEGSYLFKDGMGATEKLNLAYVLLHELAHMWFGNLVTMKWWDDLWLNESFATFIGYFTLENHPEIKEQFPNAWVKFFFYKEKGYREDQLSSSHAIAWHVEDTAQSETQFDGITYSKGASVLKQLVYTIGFENFRDAMRHYFHLHKWRNADLADFFDSLKQIVLSRNLNIDLDQWKNDWICTAGLNEINFFLDVEQNSLVGMTITQSAALKQFSKLREHRIKAGLYYDDGSCQVVELAVVNEAVSEISFGRLPQPAAVLLNYEDEDFVKARIDKKSLSFFKENLHKIREVLSRGLVWKCLLDMVKDGKISSLEYIQFFHQQVAHEKELILLYSILNSTHTVVDKYIPNELLFETYTSIFKVLYETIHTEGYALNTSLRNTLRAYLPYFADRSEDILTLVKLFDDASTPVGKLARSHKINILRLVYAKELLDRTEREQLFEGINDNTNSSANEKKRLDILEMSDAKAREAVWETFVNPPSNLSSKVLEIMMEGFNNRHNVAKNEGYVKKFFDCLLSVYEKSTYDYFSTFYKALFPRYSENYQEIFDNIEQLLQTVPKKYTPLIKSLSESQEEMETIRTNKTLCTMNRLEASTNFSWIKSSRVLRVSQSSENVSEPMTSERHFEQQAEFKPFHLQETLKTTYTAVHSPGREVPKRSAPPGFHDSQDQSFHTNEDLAVSSYAGQQDFKIPVNNVTVGESMNELESIERRGEENLKTSQSDLSKGQSIKLALDTQEDRSEILGDISILSGERDEEDEEEGTKNILRKHWKKQAQFNRGESLFKEWIPNNKSRFTEMFKADLTNFSIEKYVPSTQEAKIVTENLLNKHYVKLVLVFLHYQSESQRFPEISWTEFCNLCKEGKKVLGSTLTIRDLDKIFMEESRDSPRKVKHSNKEKSLCRYEFIEILIRMAIKKYINKKDSKSLTYNEAIDKFLEQDFIPNVKSADYSYEGYRYEKIHIDPMNAVIKANEEILQGLFQKYKKSTGNVIYLDEVKEIMEKGSFEVVNAELLKCFALSKMMVVDELNPGLRGPDVLVFIEFVEFMVRIAEIMIEAELSTHQKFEAMIPKLIAALDA